MKKRSIKKLAIQKNKISNLNSEAVKGAGQQSRTLWNSIIICVTDITKDCQVL